jgi:hypothetical protein
VSELYSLDALTMNPVRTAPNGAVGVETLFRFHQTAECVHATYSGGRVQHGYLVGIVHGERFELRYCQMHTDGSIDGGQSTCELRREGELPRSSSPSTGTVARARTSSRSCGSRRPSCPW